MRGDRPHVNTLTAQPSSFTPHARGSTIGGKDFFPIFFVYPACAGIDLSSLSLSLSLSSVYPACAGIDLVFLLIVSVTPCLPRMRGDRPVPELGPDKPNEFTPHARGSTYTCSQIREEGRVYPACAGIDHYKYPDNLNRDSLPRMRGDRPMT